MFKLLKYASVPPITTYGFFKSTLVPHMEFSVYAPAVVAASVIGLVVGIITTVRTFRAA